MSDLVVANEYGQVTGMAGISDYQRVRGVPLPIKGNKFGDWLGRDRSFLTMPTGSMIQFDLSKLTLGDFRVMRDHYQINASLAVLSFMLHQIDWWIECDNEKIKTMVEENLRTVWTRLIRALSQAFWAGYSPIVEQWENNPNTGYVEISAFKDLVPEEVMVNWKTIEGWAPPGQIPPKFKEYDGIKQFGQNFPIPPENTLWYPLLMENGDYFGRKLLKPAFPSWFFSILLHMWANRYFERFGEPVPVGRADFDDVKIGAGGKEVSGREAMEQILQNIRSRAVVVLPSDRDMEGKNYLYDIEYLESQMRGADFERYLSRLDEEMSLSIFTPALLFRTGQTGSYNLGVMHFQIFQFMLNSIAGDLKEYIDRYVVNRLVDVNFGKRAPVATWSYRLMGKDNAQTIQAIMAALVSSGRVKPDTTELGMAVGLKLEDIQMLTDPSTGTSVPAGDTLKVQNPQPDPALAPGNGGSSGTTTSPGPSSPDQRTRPGGRRPTPPRGPGQPRRTERVVKGYLDALIAAGYTEEEAEERYAANLE